MAGTVMALQSRSLTEYFPKGNHGKMAERWMGWDGRALAAERVFGTASRGGHVGVATLVGRLCHGRHPTG